MSNVIFFNSYKLKKGVSVPDFLLAVEQLNKEHLSKQKGYVSFQLLADGDTWADATTFESMEDAKRLMEATEPTAVAEHFYSFLNLSTCKTNFFTVQQSGQ